MSNAPPSRLKHRVMMGLLALVPAAILLRMVAPEQTTALFFVASLALIPLASFMGGATEVISVRLGPGLGGLMNASFGNAAEFILAVSALRAGQVQMVKASLTGSIIGNILLVFGAAVVAGGIGREKQTFNVSAARADTTLLFLATAGLAIPAVLHLVTPDQTQEVLNTLSLGTAGLLLFSYAMSLLFSLKTHKHLYNEEEGALEAEAPTGNTARAVGVLVAATLGVAVMSELVVHGVEHAVADLGFTHTFVGVIVLATVGNAAEHSNAVMVARANKMSLSLSICAQSSKQIALFVAPALVLLSPVLGTHMDLEFTPFEVVAVALSVAVIHMVAGDGEVNWLEGVLLITLYAMLGLAFYFVP